MTRLIDADALSKKLCETTIFIKDGEVFQRMINDAPTIEPSGDLISRQSALAEFRDGRDVYDIMESIEELPSAPDSRQRGKWVGCTGCEHYDQQQTRLICHECKRYYSDKYKGGDDE